MTDVNSMYMTDINSMHMTDVNSMHMGVLAKEFYSSDPTITKAYTVESVGH